MALHKQSAKEVMRVCIELILLNSMFIQVLGLLEVSFLMTIFGLNMSGR